MLITGYHCCPVKVGRGRFVGGTACVLGVGRRMSVRGSGGRFVFGGVFSDEKLGEDKKISYARGRKGGGGADIAAQLWGAPTPQHLVVWFDLPPTGCAPAVVWCCSTHTTGCGETFFDPCFHTILGGYLLAKVLA